jgi:uncharacterized protein YjbJ (UPF0337 family)
VTILKGTQFNQVINLEQIKNPLAVILEFMAQCASADRGPRNGARYGPFVRATRNAGNTWHWWGGDGTWKPGWSSFWWWSYSAVGAGGTLVGARSGLLAFRIATKKGSMMKPSSKDEVAGKIHEVKGAVKEKVGKLANNPNLEADGKVEKLAGRVQKKIGQVKKVLGQ